MQWSMLIVPGLAAIAMVFVVRARHRSHAKYVAEVSAEELCEHLRPAFDLLIARGHIPRHVGQRDPDLPLEVHLTPPFDPNAVCTELNLQPPVFVSERNVLFCKEHWCEIHPIER